MSKRKLIRQLNLPQVIMLGTAGTLAAEIFVLTGHAAAIAGPATVLALLVGGLMSFFVAINYAELGTTYPVAGGAMAYVREGFGTGILSYLTGSMDCLSSTFYAALSAVGFAYSLRVFLPFMPLVPTAIAVIGFFALLNILGVVRVGNLQIVLGGGLLLAFAIYVVVGFVHPAGFSWPTLMSGHVALERGGTWIVMGNMLATIALVYSAYVGFEVIVDDAEEIQNPNRNIPRGILISLALCTVIYVSVALVTLGTLPFSEAAGSETTLTDAARRFLPGFGVPMMAAAGMVATLTSINSAMLSATREAFSLSRDGVWPRPFSKLSRFRTPYVAILVIGGLSALVAMIGLVDFLSYLSSSGYLFVLFWATLAWIRLRKRQPNIERPFKVPLFPLTAYGAAVSCVLIIAFADRRALLLGAGVLAVLSLAYYIAPSASRLLARSIDKIEPDRDLILIAAANPDTARSLVHLAAIVGQASEDAYMCVLSVDRRTPRPNAPSGQSIQRIGLQERRLLDQVAGEAQARNVGLYTKTRSAPTVGDGILDEIEERGNVRLVLAGWPTPLNRDTLSENAVKRVLLRGRTNVAVLLDRGLKDVSRILVPLGGGLHSRMALRLAYEIAAAEGVCEMTALRVVTGEVEEEELEDRSLILQETIEEVLGGVPGNVTPLILQSESILQGILDESKRQPYDLIVMGASEEWAWREYLFGSVGDRIAEAASCSVLLCRRYQSVTMAWVRHQIHAIECPAEPALLTASQAPQAPLVANQPPQPEQTS